MNAWRLNAKRLWASEAWPATANGFKPKRLQTRVGELELSVPQVRGAKFYPTALEKGSRSERALTVALAEMYVQGVSTRRVSKIVEELCGFEVSSSDVSRATALLDEEFQQWRNRQIGEIKYLIVDARYEKIRENGCIVDCAVFVAIGVDAEGRRQVLGVSVSQSEAEVHWREFFKSLIERGLHGLELIVSDAHGGIAEARKACFAGVLWQRCQFHLIKNAFAHVPKQMDSNEVAEDIKGIFNAADSDAAQDNLIVWCGSIRSPHRS